YFIFVLLLLEQQHNTILFCCVKVCAWMKSAFYLGVKLLIRSLLLLLVPIPVDVALNKMIKINIIFQSTL
ncbi:MAG: hypothetical protein WBZ36_27910, partial [Candidatus Nitrosopolaris sp.]